ncbi:MAG: hypothetical protein KAU20_06475 [Nanoarchaeota archaeon]|nr:hypothetical protein [Nanoarchaeota archaeon]
MTQTRKELIEEIDSLQVKLVAMLERIQAAAIKFEEFKKNSDNQGDN